ncbi:MAG: HDIG domain-containing protein [Candidatus Omnitrophica bacterium]|nr:HDIG domain-containing protein [Candidatus Omnitrophota bacterium]
MKKRALKNKLLLLLWVALCVFGVFALDIESYSLLALIALAVYLTALTAGPAHKRPRPLHLIFIFVLFLSAAKLILSNNLPVFYIPVCAVSFLVTVLFNDLLLSLIMTLLCGLFAGIIAGNSLPLSTLFITGGCLATLLVWKAHRRSQIISSGLIVGLIQVVSLFIIDKFKFYTFARYNYLVLNGLFSSIFVVGALPIFEYLFKVVTNISLLELTDFNHPLLKRMVLEAPGTYHHSLIVGNLSEAAAEAIGANPLLARVGAYYHDIGKIEKAEYFSENQLPDASKHESLAPSMSKMIIMNHVKEGVDLARRYKLNQAIVDFIPQHHGTSLVYYFYKKAMEGIEGGEAVEEEVFRYPGPKPQTKEAAIVLLADSVEAATRALSEPTPTKIKEIVRKIINNKFIDGQLDECDLTLRDMEKIADVSTHILGGIYHARVAYPEEHEGAHKKQPRAAAHHQGSDKKDSRQGL